MNWGIHAKKQGHNAKQNRMKPDDQDVHLTAPDGGKSVMATATKIAERSPKLRSKTSSDHLKWV
jgi:hypothetical protein